MRLPRKLKKSNKKNLYGSLSKRNVKIIEIASKAMNAMIELAKAYREHQVKTNVSYERTDKAISLLSGCQIPLSPKKVEEIRKPEFSKTFQIPIGPHHKNIL